MFPTSKMTDYPFGLVIVMTNKSDVKEFIFIDSSKLIEITLSILTDSKTARGLR